MPSRESVPPTATVIWSPAIDGAPESAGVTVTVVTQLLLKLEDVTVIGVVHGAKVVVEVV